MGKPLPAHCEWFIALLINLARTSFEGDCQLIRISKLYPEYLTAKVQHEVITEMMIKTAHSDGYVNTELGCMSKTALDLCD